VTADQTAAVAFSIEPDLFELWPNLGDGGLRKAAYRGG
jgi:hypothetical protein